MDTIALKTIADELRVDVLNMVHLAGSGHIGGSFSSAELVTALFFSEMRLDPANPKWESRDRFILSKGHCCPILYAALSKRGFFEKKVLSTLRQLGSPLQGHPDMRKLKSLDMTSGSLGNGLSLGLGAALAARVNCLDYRVFVLLGDGECEEGAVWEAAMATAHYSVSNLIAIVDSNKLQLTGEVEDIIDITPLKDKWEAFGWRAVEINGNDMDEVLFALDTIRGSDKPCVIIANTIKGKGVSFMENEVVWHSKAPNMEEVERAISEIRARSAK